MDTYNEELIGRLWQKYCYKDAQGLKSDRQRIIDEYNLATGDDIPLGTIKHIIRRLDKERLYNEKMDNNEEFRNLQNVMVEETKNKISVAEDGTITSSIKKRMRSKQVFTNKELMELHSLNPDENRITSITSNEWTMTNVDGDQFFNFQSKIKVTPLKDNDALTKEEFIEALKEPTVKWEIEKVGIGERNLMIGLADMHFGVTTIEMLKNDLAEIKDIIENGYKTIVIAQLGDLFESSQMKESVTLRGTFLPTVDMVKAIKDAKSFYHDLIDHAVKHCKDVRIEHACGNHSGNMEYIFMDALQDRYELLKCKSVKVNNHNDWRVAFKIGSVGVMMTHGDTVKLKDAAGKFAKEYAVLWGDCESHEVWVGHKHHDFTYTDINGIIHRQFPTPKPTSDFEDKYGYLSRKLINAVEYDDIGEKGTYKIR